MKSWIINIGDSTKGQIGMVCVVRADTAEEALQKFKEQVPETIELKKQGFGGDFEYINVYTNVEVVTLADVQPIDERS